MTAESPRQEQKERVWLRIAREVATLSTCRRRQVGCVLVDANGYVLSTGYNGVAHGQPHCIDSPCPGSGFPSGEGLDRCEAIHAEQNALLQCPDTRKIHTAYVTAFPCVHCVKLLLNTSCTLITYAEPYSHGASPELWSNAQRLRRRVHLD